MKKFVICMLMLVAFTACGPSESTSAEAGAVTGSGDISKPVVVSEDSCAVLENGVVTELFGTNPDLITFRRSIPSKRAGHVVCRAIWDRPDKAALEAAYLESMQAWSRNSVSGKKTDMPKPPALTGEVSITLMANSFDSPQDAVANLEAAVARLQVGFSTTIAGKEHTTQVDFGDWIDNVGDQAVFSEKGELLVADNGRRFSVTVNVSDDPGADRDQALELARRVMQSP